MIQQMIVRLLLTASILLLASSIFAVPPDKLQPPVFVDCQDGVYKYVSHCDDSAFHQFKAYLPDQPQAQGRIRYRLVEGPGEINEKTGRWVWYPTPEDFNRGYFVAVAARVNNTDIETPQESMCRLLASYDSDTPPRFGWITSGRRLPTAVPAFRVSAPGTTLLKCQLEDKDWCDTPRVELLSVNPSPAGRVFFAGDTALVCDLLPADHGEKFIAAYRVTSGIFSQEYKVALETREAPVPQFVRCPEETLSVDICGVLRYKLEAIDPDFPDRPEGIGYRIVAPTDYRHGSVDRRDGTYVFHPRPGNDGETFLVEISAYYLDTMTTGDQNCRFWVKVSENTPPAFVGPSCSTVTVAPPGSPLDFFTVVTAVDPDSCQRSPLLFINEITPAPANGYTFDPYSGEFHMRVLPDEVGTTFNVTVGATDMADTVYCTFGYLHEGESPLHIRIESAQGVFQGSHVFIDITADSNSLDLWGFDFLVGWDAAVLTFQVATPGELYSTCDWEYFTYRYGANGNCNGRCPSGMLRVVGIAETNNGDHHPSCLDTTAPFTLATLDFLVTNDRTYECTWQPIRFWWIDCGDNTISYHPAGDVNPYEQETGLSRRVYDIDTTLDAHSYVEITGTGGEFPGCAGAPDSCLVAVSPNRPGPYRVVDFYNGGIDIVCADSIDPYPCYSESGGPISWAVLYANYFVYGPLVFPDMPGSGYLPNCTELNGDGIFPSIEDFVYLVRTMITADALPYDQVRDTVAARFYRIDYGILVEPDQPLGAVNFQFRGNVIPTLMAAQMQMKYWYNDSTNITSCLIYSFEQDAAIGVGDLLALSEPAEIVHLEAAAYAGNPVRETIETMTGVDDPSSLPSSLPTSFALYQNHPNPFNLETVIPFDLPQSGEVTLEIFNALGQSVHRRTAPYPAGHHQFTWNGRTDNGAVASSGIYYYRVSSNDHTQTRKMVLLK